MRIAGGSPAFKRWRQVTVCRLRCLIQINLSIKSLLGHKPMMLHSRALEAFIAVAEELHFGNAAKRLHVSQPPLSQQIRRFEADVGAALFVRSTRSVRLTPAGAVLLRKARQLVADGQAAIHAAQRAAAGGSGHLSIGFTSTAAYQLLPKLLAGCHSRRPDIVLSLKEDLSTHLIEML